MPRTLMAFTLIGLLGCSGRGERPPYATAHYNVGTGGTDFNVANASKCGPPVPDAGLCGNQILPTQQDRPNLYFVIDASGSMADTFDGVNTKYTAAVSAIVNVLEIIGHRVSYGAALFPVGDVSIGDNCGLPGSEIFKTQPGDSVICAINGKVGDVLGGFHELLNLHRPGGGTPLSATLTNLKSTLKDLSGKTAVILATDGAPNCNPNATCDASLCETNLAGGYFLSNGTPCAAPVNCCDEAVVPGGSTSCVDNVATNAALADLKNAGIPTYVIGLPGIVNTLAAVLDSMAVAGGTARSGYPRYYEVTDSQSLADALRTIATQIAVSCTISLAEAPPNWGQVNVYLDSEEVPQSIDDGWQQIDNQTLEIIGTYCATLQTGNVYQVQVTAGCTTYVN